MAGDILVYGAYGYTGSLVAEAATDRGLPITLGGRNGGKLRSLADDLDRPVVQFRLDDDAAVRAAIDDHDVVLNCAGPFVHTADPLVEAAIETATHYLDITGEITVFEAIHARDERARDAGVTLLPGVGFDVVPTDCLGAHLADRLPEAESLELAFEAEGPASDGTTRTSLRHLHEGGRVRRNGEIERVPLAWRDREVDFGDGTRSVVSIPWGDVSTAYHSTGIPDVTVYMSMSPGSIRWQRRLRAVTPLLKLGTVRWLLGTLLASGGDGPDAETRAETGARVWGRASSENQAVESFLRTPNTYALTVDSAIEAAQRVLHDGVDPGFQTPSSAFGPDFVLDLPGVERSDDGPPG
jgi:short subunit dehydrogenase-like uncharacterized protein